MKAPIRSMTGFARVRRNGSLGELVLSLRSVNHRGLDLQFHMAPELDAFEGAIRKAIGEKVGRGHIDVRLHFSRNQANLNATFNRPLLEAWVAAFRQASRDLGLAGEPDLNAALRVQGMLADPTMQDPPPQLEAMLLDAVGEALDRINQVRAKEGEATAAALREHHDKVYAAALQMESIRGHIAAALQARMQDKLSDLLGGSVIDPARLAQEAAILADRSDISEEITRLKIHCERFLELLSNGGEAGKRVEFLCQEMHREANTILSKSNGAGEPGRRVTELALIAKSEIEKIREQSLNLE